MKLLAAVAVALLPGPIKRWAYRRQGIRIGRGVRIGFGTVIVCGTGEIKDGASIGHFCLIRVRTIEMGKRAVIQNLVRIAAHSLTMKSQSTVCSQNQIAGDPSDPRSTIHLGPASWILPMCYVNVARRVHLGRNVGVGGGSYLFTHGMWLSKLDGFPVAYGDIVIEDDVWLPWGCFVMPNVTIGSGAIVGACAVVTKSLPAGVLAAGVPAKIIKEKSNVDLVSEDRARILAEVSEGLAAKQGMPFRIDGSATEDRHFVGEELVLVVHKGAVQTLAPPPALNAVFGPLDRQAAGEAVVWSLHDYTSSPYATLPGSARRWFSEARNIGVRFYPIDEDIS